MKFILTILAAAILLIGCAAPNLSTSTMKSETHKIFVVNSLWEVIKIIEVSDSREIISNDINAEVEAYNVETLDDFLRIYYDTMPDLSSAPLVSIYIVNPTTHEILTQINDVSRQTLIDDINLWRKASEGRQLYIDHVPPPPPNPAEVSPYSYYAIYVIEADGSIVFEDHCGFNQDGTFTGEWILDQNQGGWHSIEAYFYQIQAMWDSYLPSHPGSYKLLRQIYTPQVIS